MTVPAEEAIAAALGDRPVRTWRAVVSLEAAAQEWARAGGPDGGVVVAGYQAAPRGRAGRPWTVDHDRDLVLSVLVRPDLEAEREGWLYTVAVMALCETAGRSVGWPDRAHGVDGGEVGAASVHGELGPGRVDWAVVTMLVRGPADHPGAARTLLDSFDAYRHREPEQVVAAHRERCSTLGRQVVARMIPLGPAGPVITGTAVDLRADGALVVQTERGSRVAVRPQNLGLLEEEDGPGDRGPGGAGSGRC